MTSKKIAINSSAKEISTRPGIKIDHVDVTIDILKRVLAIAFTFSDFNIKMSKFNHINRA